MHRIIPKLVIVVGTYNAYCAKPFFPSWLGNTTSRLSFPVTLIFFPRLSIVIWGTGVADFADEDDMAATVRYGIKAAAGLAEIED
jgi:hypothetical protein